MEHGLVSHLMLGSTMLPTLSFYGSILIYQEVRNLSPCMLQLWVKSIRLSFVDGKVRTLLLRLQMRRQTDAFSLVMLW